MGKQKVAGSMASCATMEGEATFRFPQQRKEVQAYHCIFPLSRDYVSFLKGGHSSGAEEARIKQESFVFLTQEAVSHLHLRSPRCV